MSKNCDTCMNFIKINTFRDGRKGICGCMDWNINQMKGKPCPYYKSKKFIRHKFRSLTRKEIDNNRSSAYEYIDINNIKI